MQLITSESELVTFAGCAFVPTMGALHAGHRRLIEAAAERSRGRGGPGVVVSVFVNPTQFNDPRDLERYPRTLEADVEVCRDAGASAVFAPGVEDIYPPKIASPPPPLPRVATEPLLEDAHRPGHFAGVCQVVKRLFELVRPREALFGEKDWQQLQVIRAMTLEQGLGVEIVPVATVREADGLAMSSRNVFLSESDRGAARSLSRALCDACAERIPRRAEDRMRAVMSVAGAEVEYAVVRNAATLLPLTPGEDGEARALVAARVGAVRLIDNAPWPCRA